MSERYRAHYGSYDHWRYRATSYSDPYGGSSGDDAQREVWVSYATARSLEYRGDRSFLSGGCIVSGGIIPPGCTRSVPIEVGLVRREPENFRLFTYITGIASREVSGRIVVVGRGALGELIEKVIAAFPRIPIKRRPRFNATVVDRPDDRHSGWPGDEVNERLGAFGREAEFSQVGSVVRLEWSGDRPSLRVLEAATAIILTACASQCASVYR